MEKSGSKISGFSVAGLIVTLGIVFGDIGTSPLYVMKAIVGDAKHVTNNFILGALSCIIWTLTLQTTIKYVIITLRADNKGEGGIFSLFALMRRKIQWVYIFAIVGGAALLADGIITPAITVVSAVEELVHLYPQIHVIAIALGIIIGLFLFQQFGTKFMGAWFGPIMLVWFSFLGIMGVSQILHYPEIFKAANPIYAYKLLIEYPGGILLLGAVFLCTTGAEALYSDLGHCGLINIRISWIFVKITLILNYLGQGAWILTHKNMLGGNPFYDIMPANYLLFGIVIATAAAIIASQALISGSFTLISEAISLNFWPRIKKRYPTTVKGQIYLPFINWFLMFGCIFVVLFFQKSTNMEAAYGLSITITMLMTTILMGFYLSLKKVNGFLIFIFLGIFLTIEGVFLYANMQKFMHGGYVTIIIASFLLLIMYGWFNARKIRNSLFVFVKLSDYVDVLKSLSQDTTLPKYASNLVYITRANYDNEIESKIIYSILNKQPKRADMYWFLHVDITDEPDTFEYEITEVEPGVVIKIDFRLGFKVEPRINLYFRQVLDEMEMNNEIDLTSRYESLRKFNIDSDFLFVLIDRMPNYDYDFKLHDRFNLSLYRMFRGMGISDVKAYGLDTSNVLVEKVPLMIDKSYKKIIKRGRKKNLAGYME
jgi:KUP system potassium uptake protein